MNSRTTTTKARKIAMLAALLTTQSAMAADRLDDWSSPRPIKYATSSSYNVGGQSASQPAKPVAPAPKSQPATAPHAAPINPAASSGIPLPATQATGDMPAVSSATSHRDSFPPAVAMLPEHVGQPLQRTAPARSQLASHASDAPAMRFAAAEPSDTRYSPAADVTVPDARPMRSVLEVSSQQVNPPAANQYYTSTLPPLQVRPASSPALQMQLQPAAPPSLPAQPATQVPPASPPSLQPQPRSASSQMAYQPHEENNQQELLPVPQVHTKTVSNWQLGRLAGQKIAEAEALLARQSPMAARQEAIEALHLIAQSTDETTRSSEGTEALTQALAAVQEASDFLGRFGVVDAVAMQRLVDSHSTRVLKRCDLTQVTPLRAADVYYEFARGRFVDAAAGWAPASRALIIVAKTEPLTSDVGDSNLSAAQVCCLRSAIACDPENATAANDLGHELLALGMFDEARWALEHSYAKQPSTAALQNLAELHRVTGNTELAQACVTNLAALQSQQPRVAQVVQLTPSQFAQMSPQVMSGVDGQSAAAASQQPNAVPTHTEPPQQGRMASTFDRVKGIFR